MKKSGSHREIPYLLGWSSFLLINAAITVRVLHVLVTASLLRLSSISFTYTPLNIVFTSIAKGSWNLEKLIVVYGFVTLVFLVFGFFLFFILMKHRFKNLKLRLFLSWLAFLSVNLPAVNLSAGVFLYAEFGMAYTWIVNSLVLQIIIALIVLALAVAMRPIWIHRFLQVSYSSTLIDSYDDKKRFIRAAFVLPVFPAFLVVLLSGISVSAYFWIVSFLFYLLLALPLVGYGIPYFSPLLVKTKGSYCISKKKALRILIRWLVFWIVVMVLLTVF